ncbi:hypothetical protein PRZ48_007705 [Zasmidium cellare]|uniref:Uncharacterized protein n=1 Tax=Zasmidium cellare TaxID=395010 RepID=A0ABR0EKV4_ZASCE|nr:hypothetical protein PRZ48_007705 [Zasmidium cellare]
MVHSINVAEAAAIINVALIIGMVLTSQQEYEAEAPKSVFGQLIQRSKWPFLLQTDTASGMKVDKRIRIMTILSTFAGILLAVAAAITPLGLHSTIRSTEADDTPFSYVKDNSAVGLATQSHSDYVANPSIASNITDAFTSATGKSTVAGIFDIEYRSFINYNNQTEPGENENTQWIDKGRPRTQGQFRYFQQFLLENRTRPIEGLIVSTGDMPGIGFRNHTLPPSSAYGYTWEEDILWLEPETACTNLNITYDYSIPAPDDFGATPNARITDRGGLVNLPRDYPYLDLNDTQSNPQLLARSWKAAMLTNNFLRRYMNETREDSRMGKEYLIANYSKYNGSFGLSTPTPNKIEFSSFGSSNLEFNVWKPSLPGLLANLETDTSTINSSKLFASDDGFNLATVIQGYGGADKLNISTAGAGGGLILGVGKMVDATGKALPAEEFRLDPGTNWSQPIFACVSSIKASVKRVSFQLNGMASIDNLLIKEVQSKQYDSNKSMPLWAMENTYREVADLSSLWGLVSDDLADSPELSVVRAAEFYLPASSSSVYGIMTSEDAVAGAKAPLGAFGSIYTTSALSSSPDYSGSTNWLLYMKWQQLTRQIETTGKIVDLIWTDLMANALVSSKSVLSGRPSTNSSAPALQRRDSPEQSANIPAVQYSAGIAYDWKYAIPALVFLTLYLALLVLSALMFCTKGLSFRSLRFVLNQTAAGRAITTERYQASTDVDLAKTSVWARVRGDEVVRVSKHDGDRSQMAGAPQGYQAVETKTGVSETTAAYPH